MQIQKQWAVGDQLFDSYADARIYMASRRSELQHESLVAAIQDAHGSSIDGAYSAENIADAILAKFKITPRKP